MDEATRGLIREQAHELLDIVLSANGFEERKKELTGFLPTMFFNYSGHINTIEVQMNPNGWQSGENSEILCYWGLDKPLTDERISNIKDDCKEAMAITNELAELEKEIAKQKERMWAEKTILDKLIEQRNELKREACNA